MQEASNHVARDRYTQTQNNSKSALPTTLLPTEQALAEVPQHA